MHDIIHSVSLINVEDYIDHFRDTDRFIGYCKQCKQYDACWACPPFAFDPDVYLSGHETACIVGTRIVFDPTIEITDHKKEGGRIFTETRHKLDRALFKLEKSYPGSTVFLAGTCLLCERCTRKQGNPCRYPEKIRPSLEAFGFDIGKTCSQLLGIDLKWCSNALPEYFTLVSALFVTRTIPADNLLTELNFLYNQTD